MPCSEEHGSKAHVQNGKESHIAALFCRIGARKIFV